jgi:predicted dehydrogenase
MLVHSDLDALVVATPTGSHAEIGLAALEVGCHVLVEKPLAATSAEAEQLAFHAGGRVMVGHLLRYHPAVVRISELIAEGALGTVTHILCERLGTAPPGREETAWWALAPHDISVMRFLLGSEPLNIQTSSLASAESHPESSMAALLTFPEGRLGVVRVADGAARKVRRITVVGERRSVTFSDNQEGARLLHYDSPLALDVDGAELQPVHQEHVSQEEPLKLQGQHFVDCLRSGRRFASDGVEGLRVVNVLEAGSQSLCEAEGVPIRTVVSRATRATALGYA